MVDPVWHLALALKNRLRRERGQTLMEYAVLLAFIVILVVAAVFALRRRAVCLLAERHRNKAPRRIGSRRVTFRDLRGAAHRPDRAGAARAGFARSAHRTA